MRLPNADRAFVDLQKRVTVTVYQMALFLVAIPFLGSTLLNYGDSLLNTLNADGR